MVDDSPVDSLAEALFRAAPALPGAASSSEFDNPSGLAYSRPEPLRWIERLLGLTVGDELDPGHQARHSDVAHEWVLAKPVERGGESGLESRRPLRELLPLPDIEHGQPGRRRHRMAAEREDVLERSALVSNASRTC
jgi:hypothetical protein